VVIGGGLLGLEAAKARLFELEASNGPKHCHQKMLDRWKLFLASPQKSIWEM